MLSEEALQDASDLVWDLRSRHQRWTTVFTHSMPLLRRLARAGQILSIDDGLAGVVSLQSPDVMQYQPPDTKHLEFNPPLPRPPL